MGYKQYSDAFKRDVLVLVAEGGRSVSQLERDLEITPGLIYKWQQRYRVKEDVLQPSEERAEQAELRRLRGELEIVKQARDILKKAIQGFSRGELGAAPASSLNKAVIIRCGRCGRCCRFRSAASMTGSSESQALGHKPMLPC
jgi:transposase